MKGQAVCAEVGRERNPSLLHKLVPVDDSKAQAELGYLTLGVEPGQPDKCGRDSLCRLP